MVLSLANRPAWAGLILQGLFFIGLATTQGHDCGYPIFLP